MCRLYAVESEKAHANTLSFLCVVLVWSVFVCACFVCVLDSIDGVSFERVYWAWPEARWRSLNKVGFRTFCAQAVIQICFKIAAKCDPHEPKGAQQIFSPSTSLFI